MIGGGGFLKIPRSITEWDWYCDANTFRVFMHLLLTANHRPEIWRGIKIDRGQVVTGRESLAKALLLSPQEVRTSLDKLRMSGDITSQPTNKFSIVTICNYDEYSGHSGAEQPANQPAKTESNQGAKLLGQLNSVLDLTQTSKSTIKTEVIPDACAISETSEQPANRATSNSTSKSTSKSTIKTEVIPDACAISETSEQPANQPAIQPQTRNRELTTTTTTTTKTKTGASKLDFESLPPEIRRDVVLAFVEHRKLLKKPLTQLALATCCGDAMRCQALYGIDPNDAMTRAIGKGWMTCDPEYFARAAPHQGLSPPRQVRGKTEKHVNFAEKDYGENGLI